MLVVDLADAAKELQLEALSNHRRDLQGSQSCGRQSIEAGPHSVSDRIGYRERGVILRRTPPAVVIDEVAPLLQSPQELFDEKWIALASLFDHAAECRRRIPSAERLA